MTNRCPYCGKKISLIDWGDRPGEEEYWCADDDCTFNDRNKEAEEERHAQWLQDTYYDEDTEQREYY